jgi:hypothetical protein
MLKVIDDTDKGDDDDDDEDDADFGGENFTSLNNT